MLPLRSCLLLLLLLLCPGPALLLGDLVFRCPSCTAELLALCPKVSGFCGEIVREPGCGCCPVCARAQGEFCGVYTPRCATGLRCYPAPGALYPLQDLLLGLGRCGPKVEVQDVNNEVPGTVTPPRLRRPGQDPRVWQEAAVKQHLKDIKTRMKSCTLEEDRPPRVPLSGSLAKHTDAVCSHYRAYRLSVVGTQHRRLVKARTVCTNVSAAGIQHCSSVIERKFTAWFVGEEDGRKRLVCDQGSASDVNGSRASRGSHYQSENLRPHPSLANQNAAFCS
ncbi:hypothetical protein WMY93_002220 [Mugilogobius chulae]|uniref:IGFBP N-terminal domain-containing protein n=1 Tax=Mugilogobius chulae TaxID=88201 RepID=A0AAW0Q458_9GOBI